LRICIGSVDFRERGNGNRKESIVAVAKTGPGAWKSYAPSEFGGRDGVIQSEADGHTVGDYGNVGEAALILRRAALQEVRGVEGSVVLNPDRTAAGGYTEEQAREDLSPL
jgi:hypothetical protein